MYKVEFDWIKKDITTFWTFGNEEYWYKKAWSILDECGLTSYEDDFEYCEVYLRAITLSMMYSDFCKVAFDEYDYYDCYEEKYENELEDIVLGQLYAKLDGEERTTDKHYIVCLLADSKRREVFSALHSKLDEFEMFMGMYYTAITPFDDFWDTYEQYWDTMLNNSSELADDIISEDGLSFKEEQAYAWIIDGAYTVQSF